VVAKVYFCIIDYGNCSFIEGRRRKKARKGDDDGKMSSNKWKAVV
jgi:hypothetical protein